MLSQQQLSDRLEIQDLVFHYADLIDSKQFDQLREQVFTSDAHVDYSALGGSVGDLEETITFLKAACKDDIDLYNEVSSLLASDQQINSLIDGQALDAITVSGSLLQETSLEGEQVGSYKLIKKIGQGGMGVVYLAERADGQFEQQVALKLIKRGMDSEMIVRRFLAAPAGGRRDQAAQCGSSAAVGGPGWWAAPAVLSRTARYLSRLRQLDRELYHLQHRGRSDVGAHAPVQLLHHVRQLGADVASAGTGRPAFLGRNGVEERRAGRAVGAGLRQVDADGDGLQQHATWR